MALPQGRKPLGKEWFANHITTLPEVTRVEVIDDTGRAYSQWDVSDVQVSFQDGNKTLKIFLKNTPNE
jgi:hypothetical protein